MRLHHLCPRCECVIPGLEVVLNKDVSHCDLSHSKKRTFKDVLYYFETDILY